MSRRNQRLTGEELIGRSSIVNRQSSIRFRAIVGAFVLTASCQTATTRPGYGPLPGSPTAEVRLTQARATSVLAEALRADSIPVKRVEEIDGLIESDWFAVPGFQVTGDRPLGPGIVQVRAWVDVGKAGHSVYTIETVYRVYADPSRPARELEEAVAATHPARVKVGKVLEGLVKQYGEPPPPPAPILPPDTARVDTTAKRDMNSAESH